MLKKILALVAMLYAAAAFAAVDVNKATAAELDSIKGIGPGISTKIIDERKKGNFKDWDDFITRVQGVGDTNAAKTLDHDVSRPQHQNRRRRACGSRTHRPAASRRCRCGPASRRGRRRAPRG
jgi:competence protein ComEA